MEPFTIPAERWEWVTACFRCGLELRDGESCEHMRFAIVDGQPAFFANSGETMVVRPL